MLKNHIIKLSVFTCLYLVYLLLLSYLAYISIININIIKIIHIIINNIIIFIFGSHFKNKNKAFKHILVLDILIILINILFIKVFNIKTILYYISLNIFFILGYIHKNKK